MTTRNAERRFARGRGAYTLVEISIALAIVGILAGVAGTRYMTYLDRARTARVIVELQYIAAQIDPAGDEYASWPATLAAAGITTLDPWGRPYQYLLIAGNLPRGLAESPDALPPVAAPPSGAGGGGGGGSVGGSGGGSGGGSPNRGSVGGSIMGSVRKDRFLAPINTDFDLYSMGPDGDSKSQLNAKASRDDIIRAANGAYFGVASGF